MARKSIRIAVAVCASGVVGYALGCSIANISSSATPPVVSTGPASTTPIQHIVVIMQENRSFDNLFNGFPGADTVQSGKHKGVTVPLALTPLGNGPDLDHSHIGWWRQWDGGAMDNFGTDTNLLAYSYVSPSEVTPYWTLARDFTLGDRMFQSNTGPSFVALQSKISGESSAASENPTVYVWGCSARPDTRLLLIGPTVT